MYIYLSEVPRICLFFNMESKQDEPKLNAFLSFINDDGDWHDIGMPSNPVSSETTTSCKSSCESSQTWATQEAARATENEMKSYEASEDSELLFTFSTEDSSSLPVQCFSSSDFNSIGSADSIWNLLSSKKEEEKGSQWKPFSDYDYSKGLYWPSVKVQSVASYLKCELKFPRMRDIPEKSIEDLLRKMMIKNKKGTAIIKIGKQVFHYNSVLLRLHSQIFAVTDACQDCFEFDEKYVPIEGFVGAYRWLRLGNCIELTELMPVFQVASFLQFDLLAEYCWDRVCDNSLSEKIIFDLFRAAEDFSLLNNARHYLSKRISRSFLALVGSEEFMQLSAEQVILILDNDSIGVNCEAEVFYAAVRWISRDPTERLVHMHAIMKTVRFAYMPMSMLFTLRESDIWPNSSSLCNSDRVIVHFRQDPEMMKTLCETMSSFSVHLKTDVDTDNSPNARNDIILPRQWVYHKNCPYHLEELLYPYRHIISHSQFLEFINSLQPAWKGEKLRMDDVHMVKFDGVIQVTPALKKHFDSIKAVTEDDSAKEQKEETKQKIDWQNYELEKKENKREVIEKQLKQKQINKEVIKNEQIKAIKNKHRLKNRKIGRIISKKRKQEKHNKALKTLEDKKTKKRKRHNKHREKKTNV